MATHPFKVCPRILKTLEEGKDKSARFNAYKSVDDIYQVDDDNFKPFKVDLSTRQCSCRKWDLTGIPCTHAIAAIRKKGALPEDYVHGCYSVHTYLKAYGPAILPIRAPELWHKTNLPPPLPPIYKPQPGRPKKKRKIDPVVEMHEKNKWKKKGEVKRCKLCGMRGHNRTTCKTKAQQGQQSEAQVDHEQQGIQPEGEHEQQGVEFEGQFQDVQVETQVPEFVLDEIAGMSSQPSQPMEARTAIPTVSTFIESHLAATRRNDDKVVTTRRKKLVTIGGLKQKNKK